MRAQRAAHRDSVATAAVLKQVWSDTAARRVLASGYPSEVQKGRVASRLAVLCVAAAATAAVAKCAADACYMCHILHSGTGVSG